MNKEALLGKTKKELQNIVTSFDLPKFTATQIAEWIYKRG